MSLLDFSMGGLAFLLVLQLADVLHIELERSARIRAARRRSSRVAA